MSRDERILQRKLSYQKRRIDGFIESVDSIIEAGETIRLEIMGEELKEIKEKIEKLYDELFSLDEVDIDKESEACDSSMNKIGSLRVKIENERKLKDKLADIKPNGSQANIKLPQFDLPIYDGDMGNWINFKELFLTTIDAHPGLTNIQKLQYLNSAVKGEAARLIRGFPLLSENYGQAWSTLLSRYDNPRELAYAQVSKIFSLRAIKNPSAKCLHEFMDVCNEAIRNLETLELKRNKLVDVILVHFLQQKLSENLRLDWELSVDNTLPSYDKFIAFISRHARSMSCAVRECSKKEETTGSRFPKCQSYGMLIESSDTCILCKSKHHPLYICNLFCKMPLKEKLNVVKSHKLCFNCLRKGHFSWNCRLNQRCKVCKGKHHTMIHYDKPSTEGASAQVENTTPKEHESAINLTNTQQANCNDSHVLLATARIKIKNGLGKLCTCRALLDSGSQVTMITKGCCERLGLVQRKSDRMIIGVGNTPVQHSSSTVSVTFCPLNNSEEFSVEAVVTGVLTSEIPNFRLKDPNWPTLKSLKLADPEFYIQAPIDMILGADIYTELMLKGSISLGEGLPMAINTRLGWVLLGKLMGTSESNTEVCNLSLQSEPELEFVLKRFWETESVPSPDLCTQDEDCERLFSNNYGRDSHGGYWVKLPFRQHRPLLGESREKALRRFLSLEGKLCKNVKLYDQYRGFMKEYEHLNHMERVPIAEVKRELCRCYYMPHHPVIREQSTTTKMRVVFDASAKSENNVSLNQFLHKGPKIQQDVFFILLRFRTYPVAISADIEKMYRQIRIHPEDADYQRILWRPSSEEPVVDYRLLTVTYGTTSAPFLAMRTLQQLAEDEGHNYPEASRVTLNDFYVDDLLTGAQTIAEAKELIDQLKDLMKKGGFHLRKWNSNCHEIVSHVEEMNEEKKINLEKGAISKILGIVWDHVQDTFRVNITLPEEVVTKRDLLSNIARIFDPLGFLSPTTVALKIIMQELWRSGTGWDEHIPNDIKEKWNNFRAELLKLGELSIPRYVWACEGDRDVQLHGFCDASSVAYSAVCYLRTVSLDGQVHISMLAAKTRVAPCKSLTLPRLELCAALLLSQLYRSVIDSLKIDIGRAYLWSDSQISLSWIKSDPNRWKTFIHNRVVKIQQLSDRNSWRHVSGKDNPADCASRGIMPAALSGHTLWWQGPTWLKDNNFVQNQDNCYGRECHEEKKVALACQSRVSDLKQKKFSKNSARIQLQMSRDERILQRKLSYQKRRIDGFIESVDSIIEAGETIRLEIMGEELKEIKEKIEKLYDELFSLDEVDIDKESEACDSSMNKIGSLRVKIENERKLKDKLADIKPNGSQANIKLPQFDLPIYDGDMGNWINFKELFLTTIDAHPGLTNIQKLQYLNSAVKGEAARLIRGFPLLSENYGQAWSTLLSRYDNPRELAYAQVSKIFSLRAIKNPSAKCLHEFMDVCNEAIRNLETLELKRNKLVDVILVHFLQQKLSENLRLDWELSVDNTLPSYDKFIAFISRHARSMSCAVRECSKKEETTGSRFPKCQSYGMLIESSDTCILCKSKHHPLYICNLFCKMPLKEKLNVVKSHKLCFNCLRKGHFSWNCRLNQRCKVCKGKHHTMIHYDKPSTEGASAQVENTTPKEHESAINLTNTQQANCNDSHVLLATARIKIKNGLGKLCTCRALLDSGSQVTMITKGCCERLGLVQRKSDRMIIGVGNTPVQHSSSTVSVTFCPLNNSEEFSVEAVVTGVLTSEIPNFRLKDPNWPTLKSLKLADPEFYIQAPIDMILGADIYTELMLKGSISLGEGLPMAINTRLGWVLLGKLMGTSESNTEVCNLSLQSEPELEFVLKRFWETESVPSPDLCTQDEDCERLFSNNYGRDSHGGYWVKLPFRQHRPLLGESREKALRRFLSLEGKLCKNVKLYDQYRGFMKEYEHLNHMERVPIAEVKRELCRCYYMPHHPVIREQSTTTKMRVVFDASAKSENNVSLNQFLHKGPKIQQDVFFILLRFRTYPVAISADIEKMYRQIRIHPEDADYQRILWRPSSEEPVVDYRLLTVTYGTTSAPFLAMRTLQQLAEDEGHNYPEASRVTLNDFYVDDLLTGAQTIAEAKELIDQLKDLMKKGGFHLRKWNSNCHEIVSHVEEMNEEKKINLEKGAISKILGIVWDHVQDTFRVNITLPEEVVTKRDLLSNIARIFDPLGFLSPTTVALKIIMQELWRSGTGWDEHIPNDIKEKWNNFRAELLKLGELSIPRYVWACEGDRDVQLHGFCDASSVAYSAVCYLRTVSLDGQVHISMLAAKTRVAPCKSLTLPRLELCAALLLSQLYRSVIDSLKIDIGRAYLWSDSQISLSWIKSDPNRWKTFIHNRVVKIQQLSDRNSWRHVSGKDNPADCASRGIMPAALSGHTLWWQGPTWLKDNNFVQNQDNCYGRECHEEKKVALACQSRVSDLKQKKFSKNSARIQLQMSRDERILQRKLSYQKRRIDGFIESEDSIIEAGETIRLEIMGEELKEIKEKIEKLYDELFSLDEVDIDKESEACDSSMNKIGSLRVKIENERKLKDKLADIKPNGSQANIKLPQFDLPIYDGDMGNWINFKELFLTTIDAHPGLTNIQKLQYLNSAVKGEAARLIRGFPLLSENYGQAWSTLLSRYDNPRELAYAQVSKIFSLRAIKNPSAKCLHEFMDVCNEAIINLETLELKRNKLVDVILVHFLQQKLSENLRLDWELSVDNTLPSYDKFIAFISRHARSMSCAVRECSKKEETTGSRFPKCQSYGMLIESSDTCILCKSKHHPLYICNLFCKMPLKEKLNVVKSHKLCFNCLRKGHFSWNCRLNQRCKVCKGKHHTMIHYDKPSTEGASAQVENTTPKEHESAINLTNTQQANCNDSHVLLATARIKIKNGLGKLCTCRALLDSGSQVTMITKGCCERLGLVQRKSDRMIIGVGNTPVQHSSSTVSVTFCPLNNSEEFSVEAVVTGVLTSEIPNFRLKDPNWPTLKSLKLADPEFYIQAPIDMILGADIYTELMLKGSISLGEGLPMAINTRLGWVLLGKLMGTSESNTEVCNLSLQSEPELEFVLKRFWETESVPSPDLCTQDEDCERLFSNNYGRDSHGGYWVKLPFRQHRPLLGESREKALRRFLSLEGKLCKNVKLYDQYRGFMKEYEHLNHMERVPIAEVKRELCRCYYMPHHPVIREQSTTTKMRVVFDASAKSENNVSLNQFLHKGPKIQQDVFFILLRFRTYPVAISADIEKMYRQIRIHPEDADYQRILWRPSSEEPVVDYRLLTVTYGTTSAPFLAMRTLQQLAEDEGHNYPEASRVTLNDFYVDDLLTGAQTIAEAKELIDQLKDLMKKGGFHLRKWNSNCHEIVSHVEEMNEEKKINLEKGAISKILGIVWDHVQDTFRVNITLPEEVVTKRDLLSNIARIFDPLGFLSPTTVALKIIMQELWRSGTGWDEHIPNDIKEKWNNFRAELLKLGELSIPRYVWACEGDRDVQLHGFCDASSVAYSAVCYLRTVSLDGQVHISMLAAKTRVAPCKSLTLPRLELCAALLLSQLYRSVIDSLKIDIGRAYLWSDSQISLSWIKSDPNRWKTFIHNRVVKIQQLSDRNSWRHVSGKDNPADCASRGIMPAALSGHTLWWQGPTWLKDNNFVQNQDNCYGRECHEEKKVALACQSRVSQTNGDYVYQAAGKRQADENWAERVEASERQSALESDWKIPKSNKRKGRDSPTQQAKVAKAEAIVARLSLQPRQERKDTVTRIKSNRQQQELAKSRSAAATFDQSCFIEWCPDFHQVQYMKALEQMMGKSSVYQLMRMSGHVLVTLSSTEKVERLIEEGLTIGSTLLRAFPYRKKAEKIIIGNLPIAVKDEDIVAALRPYCKVASIAYEVVTCEGYTWTTGSREAFVLLNEGRKLHQLPAKLVIISKGESTPAYVTYGVRCSRCHRQGHRRATCPQGTRSGPVLTPPPSLPMPSHSFTATTSAEGNSGTIQTIHVTPPNPAASSPAESCPVLSQNTPATKPSTPAPSTSVLPSLLEPSSTTTSPTADPAKDQAKTALTMGSSVPKPQTIQLPQLTLQKVEDLFKVLDVDSFLEPLYSDYY
ncbi:hypothetical protein LAZ67_6004108, partial [Cordylochernes scorpioides]